MKKNPTNSIGKCYENGQISFTANMDDNEKLSILTEIPSFRACRANLYKFRNHFILNNPGDLDTNSEWFQILDTKDSCCRADRGGGLSHPSIQYGQKAKLVNF